MKPLLYIMRKNFKNSLRELKKKPLVMILYILLLLGFIGMIAITFLMPSGNVNSGSVEVFRAIATAALFIAFYSSLVKALESGSSFFRMPDVNIVFTAPISPKKVLIYGLINQLFMSFVVILFIAFQIPNLKNNFAISGYGILIIYICVLTFFFTSQLGGILLYSLASRSVAVRSWLKKGLNAALVLFLVGFVFKLLEIKDMLKAVINYMNSGFINYIPVIGWFRVVLMGAVSGVSSAFWLNIVFILITLAVMIFVLYKVNTDYYEDVLAATEMKEALVMAAREGRGKTGFQSTRLRKIRQRHMGSGASAIFYRQMLEYRKAGFFLINKNTLFIAVMGIASKYFFPNSSMKTVLYFSVYILFFFSIQGKWAQELDKPYIYMIPASSASKVFYATLSDNLKNTADGFLLFVIAGVMFKADPLKIFLSIGAYTAFGAVYIYGDVLARGILGSVHSKNLAGFIKALLIFAVILPGIIVSIAIGIVFKNVPFIDYYTTLILIAFNILACGVIGLLNRGIFDNIEAR